MQWELELEKRDKAALILQFDDRLAGTCAEFNQQLEERLESIRMESIAEFKRSEFLAYNLLIMQNSILEACQTKAINVCPKVAPTLDKQDPRIAKLYNPNAFEDFDGLLEKFKDGGDLRELGVD